MPALMGVDGFFSVASSSGGAATGTTVSANYIDSYGITPGNNLADVTAYGNRSKAFLPTLREWTAQASGTLDMGTTEQQQNIVMSIVDTTKAPLPCYLRFYDSTCYWSGMALLSKASIRSQVGDKVSVSYDFQGSSNLSYTTS